MAGEFAEHVSLKAKIESCRRLQRFDGEPPPVGEIDLEAREVQSRPASVRSPSRLTPSAVVSRSFTINASMASVTARRLLSQA